MFMCVSPLHVLVLMTLSRVYNEHRYDDADSHYTELEAQMTGRR